jgi:EpsI family protein
MVETKRFALTLLTLSLAAVLALMISRRGVPEVMQTNLDKLPREIANLQGSDDRFSDEVYRELNADQHVYRHYRGAGDRQVDLYIGYYGTAKGGRTGHNPFACLPGSGWAIIENGQVRVPTSYFPEGVALNYVVASKDGACNVLLHWYQAAGNHVLSTGFQQNVQQFVGRVLHNRNDGAYVQVACLVGEAQIGETKKLLKDFAQKVLEQLPVYWPVEK